MLLNGSTGRILLSGRRQENTTLPRGAGPIPTTSLLQKKRIIMVTTKANHNDWILEILSWHGHDRNGVHVPFQGHRNPLEMTVKTDLVQRMRSLAEGIAAGKRDLP